MKTSINLYLAEFKPKTDLLALNYVLYAWLASIVLIGTVFIFSNNNLTALTEQNKDLLKQSRLKKKNSEQFKLQALQHQQDIVLKEQLEALKAEIIVKRQLIQALGDKQQTYQSGYAQLMFDLAEYAHPDIWITSITYLHHKILIKGATQNPAALPIWLDNLSQSRYFAGKSFADLSISSSLTKSYSEFEIVSDDSSSTEPFLDWFAGATPNPQPKANAGAR